MTMSNGGSIRPLPSADCSEGGALRSASICTRSGRMSGAGRRPSVTNANSGGATASNACPINPVAPVRRMRMSRMARRLVPGHRRKDRELRTQLLLDRVLALHPFARRRADAAQVVRVVQDCAQMPIYPVRCRGVENRRLRAEERRGGDIVEPRHEPPSEGHRLERDAAERGGPELVDYCDCGTVDFPHRGARQRLNPDDAVLDALAGDQRTAQLQLLAPFDKDDAEVVAGALEQPGGADYDIITLQPAFIAVAPMMSCRREEERRLHVQALRQRTGRQVAERRVAIERVENRID